MKTKYILPFLIVGFLAAGCDKTIEFNGEITNPMLVVSSFITPDSAIKAELTQSRFFLDEDFGEFGGYQFDKVTNADFSLYVNGAFKKKLIHAGSGIYLSDYKPNPGEEIKIEVSATGFTSVSGTSVLPAKPLILKVDTSSVTEKQYSIGYNNYGDYGYNGQDTLSEFTYKKTSFRVKFKDDGNEKNYYRLMVLKRTYYQDAVIDTYLSKFEDIVFGNQQSNDIGNLFEFSSNNYNYDTFSDDLLNGKEYDLKFSSSKIIDQKNYYDDSQFRKEVRSTFYIYIQEISFDYFMYARSSSAAENMNENPFVEPVQIYSNIKNGIGVLGSYTSSAAAVVDVWN